MPALPDWFHAAWRRCALQVSTAGLHESGPWRSERTVRDCWVLTLLFAGGGRLVHADGHEPLTAPCAWLAAPGMTRREEVRPERGVLRLAEIAFIVHPGPGAPVPLAALEHPRVVPVRDPARAAALAAVIAGGMRGWKPADDETALAVRPDLDRLIALHLHDRLDEDEMAERSPQRAPPWLETLHRWTRAHLAERDLGVARLATVAGYSPSQVAHAYTRWTGQGPAAWIRGMRLAMAERLLRDAKHLTVGTIAARCGFANATVLARHFRAVHGTSPDAWRRRSGAAT